MVKSLNALCDCVDRQLSIYRKLLDLFHAERNALLASDLKELNQIITDKEMLLQNIRNAELARHRIAEEVAQALGIDAGTLTISRMVEEVPEPYASKMKEKGTRLKDLLDEIQVASERNRSLCLHALRFVSGSIKRLSALTRPDQVYRASGRIPNERNVGRMLSDAV